MADASQSSLPGIPGSAWIATTQCFWVPSASSCLGPWELDYYLLFLVGCCFHVDFHSQYSFQIQLNCTISCLWGTNMLAVRILNESVLCSAQPKLFDQDQLRSNQSDFLKYSILHRQGSSKSLRDVSSQGDSPSRKQARGNTQRKQRQGIPVGPGQLQRHRCCLKDRTETHGIGKSRLLVRVLQLLLERDGRARGDEAWKGQERTFRKSTGMFLLLWGPQLGPSPAKLLSQGHRPILPNMEQFCFHEASNVISLPRKGKRLKIFGRCPGSTWRPCDERVMVPLQEV